MPVMVIVPASISWPISDMEKTYVVSIIVSAGGRMISLNYYQ